MFIENLNVQGLTDKRDFNYDSLEGAEPCNIEIDIQSKKDYKDVYEVIVEERNKQIEYIELGGKTLITIYGELNFKLLMILEDNSAEIVTYKKLYSFSYIKVRKKLLKVAWLDLKLSLSNEDNLKLFLVGIAIFSSNSSVNQRDNKVDLKNKKDEENNIYLSEEFF